MGKEELQKFCLEKNILLEASLFDIFSKEDFYLTSSFLEEIKKQTGKRFFNKKLIESNNGSFKILLDRMASSKGLDASFLKNSLGLAELKIERKEVDTKKTNSKVKVLSSYPCIPKSLEVKDFITHFRNRYEEMKNYLEEKQDLENLISIGKIPPEKNKFSIIGMVIDKKTTKNKNIILTIEDLTGIMKVLISSNKEGLVEESEDITLDSILAFKGVGNKEIMFVNEIIFPDTYLSERKKGVVDEYALFTGDVHFGSKNFLENDFLKFIDYLNGKFPNTPEIEKIKYLFIVGDLITGVGNYPNQEPDLLVVDLEDQFKGIANLLSKIRKDIKIIISPGNHDCVRLMEPQPLLDEKYSWPLYELENVLITENPSLVNIGEMDGFEGFNILTYHGFSFPYYANNVSKLMLEKTMNEPEKIMKYLLKNRHLAPTHGSTQYFPLEKDGLLIRRVPDIFVSGHTHKSGVVYYNNILIVSSSSWEGLTPYQEKFGNKPDHCKVPMFNLKTRAIKILDFETKEEKNEKN